MRDLSVEVAEHGENIPHCFDGTRCYISENVPEHDVCNIKKMLISGGGTCLDDVRANRVTHIITLSTGLSGHYESV
jgi:hypothetical protein